MEKKHTRGSFTGSIGFVLAAAGSAVGLGNIWRFPYLAAKDGGGTFILVYIVLALTFGFTLLTTDIAIGRKTGQSPLVAYGKIHPGWNGLGLLASIVPVVILPYYCSIGGWVLKYLSVFLTGHGTAAAEDGYFTGYITGTWQPIVWLGIYLFLTAFVVYRGVNKGIENYSKILMPILLILIIGISVFSLTLTHTDADGVVRTGLQGMKIYLVPNFKGMTLQKFFTVFVDALGQLFFSISVAMGIMVAYGSYVKKETNLMKSINQIEIFDTIVALLAGLMIVPAVFTFMGTEGMSAGPGLMFVSLPKVFQSMGAAGGVDIRLYRVIYQAIEDVEAAMKGMLEPVYEEKVIGHAEVRQLFKASGVGTIAGSYVLDGTFQRGCKVRISREGNQIFEGNLASLKRFKDDVKEVRSGYECGLVFEGFNDLQEFDQVEAYIMVEVPR